MTHDHLANAPHYVYRCLDATGRVIYVGCTYDLGRRIDAHTMNSFWAPQVAKVVATVHPDRRTGREVERFYIRQDDPRFNVSGRHANHLRWTVADYDDYIYCREALQPQSTSWVTAHLIKVRADRAALAAREGVA